MWALMMMVMIGLSNTISVASQECNKPNCKKSPNETREIKWSDFENCEIVNLSNTNIGKIVLTSLNYSRIKILDLSSNKLRELPKDFLSNAIALEEINIANNNLNELPKNFLNNSSKLKVVHLEGNLLTDVPLSIFHPGLLNLSINCRCDVASSIIQHINSTRLYSVKCSTHSNVEVDEFFASSCGSQIVLYIVLPLLVLGLVIGGVALYLCKKKNNSCDLENKSTSDKSPSHGQSRYTTTMDVTTATSNKSQRQDYENVFVGNPIIKPYEYLADQSRPGAHSTQAVEEDLYLESDVNDQPIYSNTQGVYYNYQEPSHRNMNKEEDNVYILPDH